LLEAGDAFGEEVADEGEADFVADFFACGVGDVEDVDDLVEVGGDFGEGDVESEFPKDAGDDEEESSAVVGEDVDDGVGVRGLVVGDDVGRFLEEDGDGLGGVAAVRHEEFFDGLAAEEDFADGFSDFGHADGGDWSREVAIDDLECVEDGAVVAGDDLGGEDFESFGGECAADFAEAAGAVFLPSHHSVFGQVIFAILSAADDDVFLFEASHGDEEFEQIGGGDAAEVVGGRDSSMLPTQSSDMRRRRWSEESRRICLTRARTSATRWLDSQD